MTKIKVPVTELSAKYPIGIIDASKNQGIYATGTKYDGFPIIVKITREHRKKLWKITASFFDENNIEHQLHRCSQPSYAKAYYEYCSWLRNDRKQACYYGDNETVQAIDDILNSVNDPAQDVV